MIEQLSSKEVYRNKWMRVREDDVRFPDGHEDIYGVVERPDYAMIVPVEGDSFYLVRQYRYTIGRTSWEFPAGSHEGMELDDSERLARDELQEETGLLAGRMRFLGKLAIGNGGMKQFQHTFLASELTRGEQQLEVTEQGLEVGQFSREEFLSMVRSGEIVDVGTVAAFSLLVMYER